jgi:hypothetical protein
MESQTSCKDYLESSNSTLVLSNQALRREMWAQALSILLNSTMQVNCMGLARSVFPEQTLDSDPCMTVGLKTSAT